MPTPGECCADCELELAARSQRILSWAYGVGVLAALGAGALVLATDASQWFFNHHPAGTFVCAGATAAGTGLFAYVVGKLLVSRAFLRRKGLVVPLEGEALIAIAPKDGEPIGRARWRNRHAPRPRGEPPRFWITWWR